MQTLIDTDNAVRASEFELSAAETEFGAHAVAAFRKAFDSARESLTAAFEIRQRVDDEIPEDDATKRAMMNEILDRCAQAADALDAESDRFDELRDLRSRLPQVLAELPGAIQAQQARLAGAGATLQRLQQQYAPTAFATVTSNDMQASERLDFARTSLQQAQDLDSGTSDGSATRAPTDRSPRRRIPAPRGAGRRRRAGSGRSGRRRCSTPIERTDTDLAAAIGQLSAACAAVDHELLTARQALAAGDAGEAAAGLGAQLDQIQAILGVARSPQGSADPLTALHKVEEADLALDTILAATRDAQQRQQRAHAALAQALPAAQAEVGVGGGLHLHPARRGRQPGADPAGRGETASGERAIGLPRRRGRGRRRGPAGEHRSPGRPPSSPSRTSAAGAAGGGNQRGGGLGGAVLGGILLNSVLNSGRSGRGGGGWGGGGFGGGGVRRRRWRWRRRGRPEQRRQRTVLASGATFFDVTLGRSMRTNGP